MFVGGNEVLQNHRKTPHCSFIDVMTQYDPQFRENMLYESGFRPGRCLCVKKIEYLALDISRWHLRKALRTYVSTNGWSDGPTDGRTNGWIDPSERCEVASEKRRSFWIDWFVRHFLLLFLSYILKLYFLSFFLMSLQILSVIGAPPIQLKILPAFARAADAFACFTSYQLDLETRDVAWSIWNHYR